MLRQNRLQLKILSLAMATALLSGCAHRAPADPTTTTSFQKQTTAPAEMVVTNGKEEEIPATEPFYNSEDIILTPPEQNDPQGRKISRSICQNPFFVGDRIIAQVYLEYEEEIPEPDGGLLSEFYWAIFDLQGQFVGRIQNETMGYCSGFTTDGQGNIVAAFEKNESLYLQRFDLSGNPVTEEKNIEAANCNAIMNTSLICSDDLGTLIACDHMLLQLDKNDEFMSREIADETTYFMGFLEENGRHYIMVLTADAANSENGMIRLDEISVSSDGSFQHEAINKNADALFGLKVYPTQTGVYCASRNAFGKLNIADGTFSTLLDWNQTDIDRSYIFNSAIKVLSEGELSQPLSILPENIGPETAPQVIPQEETPASASKEGTPAPASKQDLSGNEKTSILIASSVYALPDVETHLIKVELADENPHAGQDTVWIGGIGITDSSLMKSISSFNKDASKGIWVKVYDYSDFRRLNPDDTEARKTMQAQINSGVGPDIIIASDSLFASDNSQVFANLNGYMDGPAGINRNEFFNSAFRAFETDGKLYQIPLGFQAYALLGNNACANGKTELNYSDYIGLMQSSGSENQIISSSPEQLLCTFVEAEMSSWIDYANDKVNIDKTSLQEMFSQMELFVKANGEEFFVSDIYSFNDLPEQPQEYPENRMSDLFSGAVKFCPAWMNSLSEYSYKEILPGELSWYGYPGSAGCTPLISSTRVAGITYYSTQKDKAWEVIKYMLSEDIQYTISFENTMDEPYTDLYTSDIIPVNVAAFRKLNKEAMGGDVVLGVPQAEMDRFKISTVRMDKLLDEYEETLKKPLRRKIRDERVLDVVISTFDRYLHKELDVSEAADTIEKEIRSMIEG